MRRAPGCDPAAESPVLRAVVPAADSVPSWRMALDLGRHNLSDRYVGVAAAIAIRRAPPACREIRSPRHGALVMVVEELCQLFAQALVALVFVAEHNGPLEKGMLQLLR